MFLIMLQRLSANAEICCNSTRNSLLNSWHEISRDKIPNDVDILIRFEDGSIKRYDEELPELLVTHWCEIPQFKEK